MRTGSTLELVGVSMDGAREIRTRMPIMLLQDTDDPMALIREASIEYCRTRQGLADYDGNGRNFDLADFWFQVPNKICVKHGILKLDDMSEGLSEDADKPLFDLTDLEPTDHVLEDVYNELTAGPVGELKDMLYGIGYEHSLSFLDDGIDDDAAAIIRKALREAGAAAREDILCYWMDHCASIYAECGDGEDGVAE